MSELRGIPSLDELAAHPERAAEVSPEGRTRLALACSAILAALAATMATPNGRAAEVPPGPALLTVAEAAQRANVPVSWIRQAVKDGRLPSMKLGHYRRIKPNDLEHFLTAHPR